MNGSSLPPACDDSHACESMGRVRPTGDQQDFVAAPPRCRTTFRTNAAVTVEPDPKAVFHERPLPSQGGGRANRAPEFHVISGTQKEQFWAPTPGIASHDHRSHSCATEIIKRDG